MLFPATIEVGRRCSHSEVVHILWILIADAARAGSIPQKAGIDDCISCKPWTILAAAQRLGLYTDSSALRRARRRVRAPLWSRTRLATSLKKKNCPQAADLLTKAVVTKECDSLALVAPRLFSGYCEGYFSAGHEACGASLPRTHDYHRSGTAHT